MSDRLRVSVEVDVTDFSKGMDRAADTLDEVDAKVRKAKSRWESVGDSLKAISPTFSKISDEWKKASEEIDKRMGKNTLGAKAMKVGVVASLVAIAAQAAKTAAQFADETARMFDPQAYSRAQGKLEKSIKRLKTTVGSFTSGFVNSIKNEVSKALDNLSRQLEEINKVISYLSGFLHGLFDPVADAVRDISQNVVDTLNAIAGLVGLGDIFRNSFSDVSDSAGETADSMGEVVQAVSAGLASFDKLSTLDFSGLGDSEQAEEIKDASKKYNEAGKALADKVRETIGKIGDWFNGLRNIDLTEIWTRFESGAADAWRNVKSWGEGVWNDLTESIGRIWDGLTDAWDWVRAKLIGFFDELIPDIDLGGVWDDFYDGLVKIGSKIKTFLVDLIQGFLDDTINKIPGVDIDLGSGGDDGNDTEGTGDDDGEDPPKPPPGPEIKGTGSNALNNIAGGISDALESAGKALESVGNAIADNFMKNSYVGQGLSKIGKWLGFASGGVVQPNDPFLALVGDNKTEAEVISPVSTMKSAFKEAMSEMRTVGAGGGGSIGGGTRVAQNITLSIDGKQLARLTFDDFVAEARRRGMRVGQ